MEDRYFNFPIVLLKNSFDENSFADIKLKMSKIMDYSLYSYFSKIEGNEDEKFEATKDFYSFKFTPDCIRNGQKIFQSLPGNLPFTGINMNMAFDFYDNYKSHDDIAVLLAFLGLKSIIGNKAYIKTNNSLLITRMAGYARINEMLEPLPEPLKKYTTRRKLDKIKYDLQTVWNLSYYSIHTRGFYASFSLSLDELALRAEKQRKATKIKELQQKKEKARINAIKLIKNEK